MEQNEILENMEQLCKSSLQYLMISTNWIELDKPYMLVPILQ